MKKLLEVVVREKCERFAKELWNVEFNLPIKISGQMSRALGRYRAKSNPIFGIHIPVEVAFASKLFEYHNEEAVDGVIKHELTHWYLGVNRQPNGDGHPVFERELKRVGAPSTRVLPSLGVAHTVKCACCGKVVLTRKRECDARKYEKPNYKSTCCRSNLVYGGIQEIGDKSKGFLASLMNKKVEAPKAKKQTTKAPKVNKEQLKEVAIKPAQRIKEIFATMVPNLNKKQLSNLTNEAFCDKTFGLKYSFLKEFKNDNDRKVNGHNRYYAGTITIFGKQYIMCNDLYAKNVEKFEAWANA